MKSDTNQYFSLKYKFIIEFYQSKIEIVKMSKYIFLIDKKPSILSLMKPLTGYIIKISLSKSINNQPSSSIFVSWAVILEARKKPSSLHRYFRIICC